MTGGWMGLIERVWRRRLRWSLPAALVLALLLPATALADPDTTIETGPPALTNDDTPTFTFSSDYPLATFECRVDDDPFGPCSDPLGQSHTTEALPDGQHTFEVRAVDLTTLPDPTPDSTPASQTFTVDTTPPDTSIDSGPSGTTGDPTPTFDFSGGGAGTTYECRVDSDPFGACSGPGRSHTTNALAEGAHTFEVRAIDAAGNADPDPASRSFTVDTTPPNTSIDSGPSGTTADPTPTFGFSSQAGATFECRIDADPFGTCSGPGDTHTPGALADGPHTFEVRAIDAAGNADPDPASRSFTVDTTPPNTTIDSGPSGTTADPTPTFDFSGGGPGATFECRVDSDPFGACSGPGRSHTTNALADGAHTFEVRATDAAGNADPDPASRSFTVDTTPPNTSIDSGPSGTTGDPTPTFDFSGGGAGATFECRVDSGPFGDCSGPGRSHTTGALADGAHTFEVRATDAAGNVDPSPATRSFSVDSSAPGVEITNRPPMSVRTRGTSARVLVEFSSEAGAAFECRLDDREYQPCDSPFSTAAGAEGGKGRLHSISVRATDNVGNTGAPTRIEFRVRRTPPLAQRAALNMVRTALKRHDFALRVVKAVEVDCNRRSRYEFACRFSARFPGYKLRGRGAVRLGDSLSYAFRVKAQGVRLTLTDENEES